ncbi:hypothetical protein LWI29_032170 [Acer saccharum]|uniref:Uncharacterized protein n=1 Tax=Acer saccharum TaxID=4024 RepID=A0AA39RNZ4_ACESA|nr:hypothetical protein LWI29_032170 [Acer saccharum]
MSPKEGQPIDHGEKRFFSRMRCRIKGAWSKNWSLRNWNSSRRGDPKGFLEDCSGSIYRSNRKFWKTICICYCSVQTLRFMRKPFEYGSSCGDIATLECSKSKLFPWFWFSLLCGLSMVKLNTISSGTKHTLLCWCTMKTWMPITLDVELKCQLA